MLHVVLKMLGLSGFALKMLDVVFKMLDFVQDFVIKIMDLIIKC